jgi:hypothetical protein
MISSHPNPTRRRRRGALALVVVGVSVMGLSQAAWAAKPAGSPGKSGHPGNNGTIKIDGVPLQGGPRNEPHVDCDFNLKFFGYDEGADLQATVLFALMPPTLRSEGSRTLLEDVVPIGEDPPGGGTDLDASRHYRLDFTGVDPHPKQGYHVKVTIHADGSRGADVKHKVFWVEPCDEPTTTTTVPEETTTTTVPEVTTTTVPEVTTTTVTTEAPAVEGRQVEIPTTTTTAPAQVLGAVEVNPAQLPRTGTETQTLAFLGGLALALGGALTLLLEADKRRLGLGAPRGER